MDQSAQTEVKETKERERETLKEEEIDKEQIRGMEGEQERMDEEID